MSVITWLGRLAMVTVLAGMVTSGGLLAYGAFGVAAQDVIWLSVGLGVVVWMTFFVAMVRQHADGALAPWQQRLLNAVSIAEPVTTEIDLRDPVTAPLSLQKETKTPVLVSVPQLAPDLPAEHEAEVIDLRTRRGPRHRMAS